MLVGPSFGAMVALVIARREPHLKRIVLVSPLISIQSHIQRVRQKDVSQVRWFSQRFSAQDRRTLHFMKRLAQIACPVSLVYSGCDEVLGTEAITHALKNADRQKKAVRILNQKRSRHFPVSRAAQKARFAFIARQIRL